MSGEREPGNGGRARLWERLKAGLNRTHARLVEQLGGSLEAGEPFDEEARARLEEALLGADLGLATTELLLERLEERSARARGAAPLRDLLVEEVAALLEEIPAPPEEGPGPRVTLVVGVNGVGKTTSIAKLAARELGAGRRVLLAAGDTFRAAAIEQLALWGERLGVGVIRQAAGSDPAAVVYDAIQAARARRADHLIVDTAGRLHNKEHLMNELAKIRRVVDREAAGWACRTLLVLDATTGQNALSQAREFLRVARVDGVLLAKLDGTAKGGMVLAIGRELGLPVLYLGVGEQPEDLVDFRPRDFAAALLE
ncbi:MAG: signal recognition particle-docking protein FtsY [Thermoanaerobaculia bacterium]|nr:signal recognition particle-docking protein FtsY [Thermoanaerobaculia bacterium]MCZ7650980.1 signal recognition particle-docking protein FtsY [Thermoanaerobaculia bacterium]